MDRFDTQRSQPASVPRRHIGVFFACCRVYARIYRTESESSYRGRCPRCLAEVDVPVGPGGTSQRIFIADRRP